MCRNERKRSLVRVNNPNPLPQIEISGKESKIEAFIDTMREFGTIEMVRTGRIAMLRDDKFINAADEEESVSETQADAKSQP